MSEKPDNPQTRSRSSNTEPDPPAIYANGHNPADYDWVPVLRKRRKDGWTPEKQRKFICTLADTGIVIDAARAVGMSDTAAYRFCRAHHLAKRFIASAHRLDRISAGFSVTFVTFAGRKVFSL